MSNYTLSTFSGATPTVQSLFMDNLGNAIAGSTTGLYYSSNYGQTWTQSSQPSGTFGSVFMDQSVNAIAAGNNTSNNGLWYSSNNGKNWTRSNYTNSGFNVYMAQNGNAIAGNINNLGMWYSQNYGQNWIQSNLKNRSFYAVFMNNLGNAIAGSNTAGLYYSSNYGQSWIPSDKTSGFFYSVFMDQNGNAIAGGYNNNGIWYSSDYGKTWTLKLSGTFISVFMDQNGNAIAGCNNNGIYYSQNYGQNWIQSNQIIGSFYAIFMDQNGNAIAGRYGGLYYSSDYGHTWNLTNVTTTVNTVFMTRIGNQLNRLSGGDQTYYFTELVCFKEDTKILTDKGYVAIQSLKRGDLVKTLNDFIPIHAIAKREIFHPATQYRDKDQLYKCSSDHFQVFEDLVITGCHSILVDEFKEGEREKTIEINGDAYVTEKKYRLPACVDARTTVYETPGTYTIYHFALENDDIYNNYGVYANGLLVETCCIRNLMELSNMDLIE